MRSINTNGNNAAALQLGRIKRGTHFNACALALIEQPKHRRPIRWYLRQVRELYTKERHSPYMRCNTNGRSWFPVVLPDYDIQHVVDRD